MLVASEWYLTSDGIEEPASLDIAKARAMLPDWTTFNGYANQYVTHPLTAEPGETRSLLGRRGRADTRHELPRRGHDLRSRLGRTPTWRGAPQQGVQTVQVPAGGGGVFDVKIAEPGLYPFVSHAFAHVDLGQVGLLKVGNPKGTASH